ncbi:MAG: hypothetical protein ACKOXZ_11890 [Polynucleobacter victoriensis]
MVLVAYVLMVLVRGIFATAKLVGDGDIYFRNHLRHPAWTSIGKLQRAFARAMLLCASGVD